MSDPRDINRDASCTSSLIGCYPIHWLRTALRAEPQVLAAQARLNPLGADLEVEATLEFPEGIMARVSASIDEGVPLASTLTVEETYDHQLAAVVDALSSGEPLPTEGQDPVRNMRVIDAVYAAAGVPGL